MYDPPFMRRACRPIAVLLLPVEACSTKDPTAVLPLAEPELSAWYPTAVFSKLGPLLASASFPTAVL
jgi:hypothetical protein